MFNNENREIVPIDQPELVKTGQLMPLDQARRILQAVVSTHEEQITPATPLEVVAGFSTQQIRDAATAVGVYSTSLGRSETFWGSTTSTKDTPQGRSVLRVSKELGEGGKVIDEYQIAYLALLRGGLYQIEAEFPLREPRDNFERIYVSFKDFRRKKLVSLYSLSKNPNLADYQHLFRGTRWLFANMLDWERRDLIMPEQLDHLALP